MNYGSKKCIIVLTNLQTLLFNILVILIKTLMTTYFLSHFQLLIIGII